MSTSTTSSNSTRTCDEYQEKYSVANNNDPEGQNNATMYQQFTEGNNHVTVL